MSGQICAVPQCDNPPHGGFLCTSCVATLRRDLKAVPDLLIDLEITISRQDKIGETSDRKTAERPLPLRLGPMEARRDLRETLYRWVTQIDPLPFSGKTESFAQHLLGHIDDIVNREDAGDCADELGYIIITAQRAVDKPLQLRYAGPCDDCTADLYAHPRAAQVACRECGLVYQVEARRQWLLGQAEDQLLTATEMSRALPDLLRLKRDKQLTASVIRGWAKRGLIAQHPPLPARPRDPLYRLGDVLDRVSALHWDHVAS